MYKSWKHSQLLIVGLLALLLGGLFATLQYFLYGTITAESNIKSKPLDNAYHLEFAILDHDYVMQESVAAQQARIKIDQQRSDFQDEVKKYEQNLRQREMTLVELQRTLNEVEYTKKQREYEFDFSEIQRKVAERRHQLDELFNKTRESVVKAVLEIASEIAEERSLEFILPRSTVLYAKKNYDITNEVLSRLNKILPEVVLNTDYKENTTLK